MTHHSSLKTLKLKKPSGERRSTHGLAVQKSESVSPTTANVLLHMPYGVETASALNAAVEAAFDGRVRVVGGSAHYPLPGNKTMIQAAVTLNSESRFVDESDASAFDGLTQVTANVFSDRDENIWEMVGSGDAKRLVKKSEDDLSAILLARQAASMETASARIRGLHETPNIGGGIGWFDVAQDKMRFGICLASTETDDVGTALVMDAASGAVVEIAHAQTVLVSDADPVIARECAATVQHISRNLPAAQESAPKKVLGKSQTIDRKNWLAAYMRLATMIYGGPHSDYVRHMKEVLAPAYSRAALRVA